MSTIFYTSDLHIGHRLVAEERAERVGLVMTAVYRAPEESAEAVVAWHDNTLAKNWDKVVSPEDTVVVVGDIAAGAGRHCRNALAWLAQRNGTKRLISGNHDPVHGMHRDAHKYHEMFREVFTSVSEMARIRVDGNEVMVSHFPYDGDHSTSDRHTAYRLRDEGVPVLHGHTHSMEKVSESRRGTRQVHVGVDAWGLTPVSVATLGELLR